MSPGKPADAGIALSSVPREELLHRAAALVPVKLILVLGGRRSGYIISLIGGIFGLGIVILHMSGRGMVGGHVPPNTPGAFFWVLTMIAIASTSSIAGILSAMELWKLTSRNRQT